MVLRSTVPLLRRWAQPNTSHSSHRFASQSMSGDYGGLGRRLTGLTRRDKSRYTLHRVFSSRWRKLATLFQNTRSIQNPEDCQQNQRSCDREQDAIRVSPRSTDGPRSLRLKPPTGTAELSRAGCRYSSIGVRVACLTWDKKRGAQSRQNVSRAYEP